MKFVRLQFVLAAGAIAICAIAVALTGQRAWSRTARTIKIVVPVSPGGVADALARLLGEQIGRAQGQTVLIENRTGAGGVIAAEAVSRAAPDGNTPLMASPDMLIPPHLRKLSYDPLTGFEPICNLVSAPTVIVVNNASPYRTLADLVSAARAQPGDLTLASLDLQLRFKSGSRCSNARPTSI